MSTRQCSGRVWALAVLAAVAGCSPRVPFTRALIGEYHLTNADIKQLQFYVSDGIVLEREVTSIDKDIDQTHSLKKVEDRYIQQICFKTGTPCIATEAQSDALSVAFEPNETLRFKLDSGHARGQVYLYEPERKRSGDTAAPRLAGAGYYGWHVAGAERYADTTFDVLLRREAPYLLVDEESLKNLRIDARVVPGMRQTDAP